ncbi:MAG: class I SAM-dependent methyltransferase [Candidatus Micrarchaeota archaeon]|nr:class I SAM-dependent methyltransferase [Candidatus Micrarchaeota archaeon]
MGVEIKKRLGGKNGLLALDIASNDGCLLKEFRSEGFKVVGVEPATNLAAIARADAITTFDSFWSAKTAENIVKELGKVDVITATNVLAHVDDVNAFVSALDIVLNENGLVVIEVPTVANIVEKNQFDTIYHEHLSYFLLKPLMTLFERNGFNVIDIQQFEIHGGSMRIFAAKKSSSLKKNEITINQYIEMEELKQLYSLQTYLKLARNVEKIKKELLSILTEINEGGKHVAAYGASAKGNTLLNYCGIGTNLISFIIDDTPEKQNCLAPGNHIPILPYVHLEEKKPQYLVLLAWNFARELISKTSVHRNRGGKYIIPIPEVKIVSSENEL